VHRLITAGASPRAGGGGGYPEITNSDVTINGFSQAGSSANSNTMLTLQVES